MTEQLQLELPPRSHTADPDTSHDAEGRTRRMRGKHLRIVYSLVRLYPHETSSELTDRLLGHSDLSLFSADRHARLCQVRKRLSDLRVAGKVEISGRWNGESTWAISNADC